MLARYGWTGVFRCVVQLGPDDGRGAHSASGACGAGDSGDVYGRKRKYPAPRLCRWPMRTPGTVDVEATW